MQKWISIVFLLLARASMAQEIENIEELSLEDLLNIKTSVASKTERSTRESPGIVTVLTKDEIKKMGARDLIDALRMVPGFNFGHDVQGVVGLGVRGSWGHEGKFSLLVDGQEMNEILYSTTQFGNHYPIDHIKQIEIIRGPGSAIYGGYAELAVIHVHTEKGADLNGGKVVATYGQMKEDFGRRNLSVQYGKKFEDWDVSVAGMIGRARRGDGSYTGYAENPTPPPNYISETYDYSEGKANDLNPGWLNVGISNSKLDFRFIYDNYRTTTRSQYGYTGYDQGVGIDFESIFTSLKYDHQINESWSITPYISYKNQNPWNQTDADVLATASWSDINAQRTKVGISAMWKSGDFQTLLFGAEYYQDKAKAKLWTDDGTTPNVFTMTNSSNIDFDGLAAYVQDSLNFEAFEVTLGARWEQIDTPVGRKVSNTVPRLAVTHAAKTWHVKGLASQAYRVPAIFNFELDYAANGTSVIKPELTTTVELEAGYAVSSNSYLTLNIFNTHIKDPIIYASIGGTDNYFNFPAVSTNGAELEYKVKYSKGYTNMNYSFYQKGKNEVPAYDVPNSKSLMGLPQHKATILTSVKTGLGNLHANPSVVYMSGKYTYAYDAVADAQVINKLDETLLVNLYFTYPDLFVSGLELGFGVYNLLDEENRYVQPYDGGLGSVPGTSREILGRLTYTMAF